jgi:hypothetical protein
MVTSRSEGMAFISMIYRSVKCNKINIIDKYIIRINAPCGRIKEATKNNQRKIRTCQKIKTEAQQ